MHVNFKQVRGRVRGVHARQAQAGGVHPNVWGRRSADSCHLVSDTYAPPLLLGILIHLLVRSMRQIPSVASLPPLAALLSWAPVGCSAGEGGRSNLLPCCPAHGACAVTSSRVAHPLVQCNGVLLRGLWGLHSTVWFSCLR